MSRPHTARDTRAGARDEACLPGLMNELSLPTLTSVRERGSARGESNGLSTVRYLMGLASSVKKRYVDSTEWIGIAV